MLDSSIILPLVSKGCSSHGYASDLFRSLSSANAALFTTPRLLKEVWQHLKWAADFVREKGIDSPDFLIAAMAKDNFKQNLFIDGYICLSADGTVGTFKDYLELTAIEGFTKSDVEDWIKKIGVQVVSISDLTGFVDLHWATVEELKEPLATQRKHSGTYKGDNQIEAEAEVLAIIRHVRAGDISFPGDVAEPLRTYFVSQSRSLDKIDNLGETITWSPEALYRYVNALPGATLQPELLQKCMLSEYYYTGITFIDKPRYRKFFGPAINQSKLDYQEQVQKYLADTEQTKSLHEFDEEFDRVPDLEKPFFVSQMGWKHARKMEKKASEATESADAMIAQADAARMSAESRAYSAESAAETERRRRATAEDEANRQRNLLNPKHLRKRKRQAKKRQKKKKR